MTSFHDDDYCGAMCSTNLEDLRKFKFKIIFLILKDYRTYENFCGFCLMITYYLRMQQRLFLLLCKHTLHVNITCAKQAIQV